MKKWPFVALLLLGSTILGATVLREPIALAAQGVDATIIGPLDGQGNVKVHEQGTAAVSVRGTPSVRMAREPFQQFVSGSIDAIGPEDCELVEVPAGKRLTIESFSADVGSTASPPAMVFLKTLATEFATNHVRSLRLPDANFTGNGYAGSVQTLLFEGEANAPTGTTYEYAACISNGPGSFRGFVSGYLEPEA